jgi:predicted TIM-barrel fold metal-dependent hydrolase
MRRGLLIPSLMFASACALGAGAPVGAASPTPDETELREIKEVLWPRAYREGDAALLDRLLAEEFRLIDPNGEWSDKATELAHVARSKWINRSFRFEIRRLEVFENGTAVVAGRGVVVGPESDPDGGYQYQSSNVLIRRAGRWQAIASHVSGFRTLSPEELAAEGVAVGAPPGTAPVPPPAPARSAPRAGSATSPEKTSALFDHHVHLLGPDLLRDWKSLGVPFSRPDEVYLSARTLLAEGGAEPAVVEGVALVSMAHMYGRSGFRAEMGLSLEEERTRAARENDHVVREAARTPGRAVAFCSVAVLRPYAEAELDRCHAELHAAGVKLHLAASDVDLADANHLEVVGRILARAEERGQPVLLHVDPQRRGLVAADIAHFARTVLAPRRELTLLVAHLGGSGGYGPWTRQVFGTLVDWLEERRAAGDPRPRVFFDTSAVILEKESEGVPPTTTEEASALGADLRRAGLGRIVLGSDHPVFDPRRTLALLTERAGLTPGELATIAANRPLDP